MQRLWRIFRIAGYERKLLLGMLLIAFAFLPALGFATYSLAMVTKHQERLNTLYTTKVLLAERLQLEKTRQDGLLPMFVLSGDPNLSDAFFTAGNRFDDLLNHLGRLVAGDQRLTTIRSLQRESMGLARTGITMKQTGEPTASVDAFLRHEAGPLTQSIVGLLQQFADETDRNYENAKAADIHIVTNVFRLLALSLVLSLAFCVAVGSLLVLLVRRKRQRDVLTERMVEQERLVSIARKEAVETVAHDLKNPLTAMMAATELLGASSDVPEGRCRSMIGVLSNSANSMHRLVVDLLDHSKIEAGTMLLSPRTTDMRSLLVDLIERYDPLARDGGVALVNQVSAQLPLIQSDIPRLEQVFSNLITNAIKFTPAGGTVSIATGVETDMLAVSVTDTGLGMTDAQTKHIFDRYWQGRDTASDGTGLGLAISKAIVQAHHGTITVLSKEGAGSTFLVRLPLRAEAEVQAALSEVQA